MNQGMRRLSVAAGVLATLRGPATADAQDELEAVLFCMRANIPRSVLVKDVELTATDRVGGAIDGQGELGGRAVRLRSLEPDPAEASRYTGMKVWVGRQTCVSLRADFYEGDTVRKRWTVDPASLSQAGRHWYAGDSTMSALVEKTNTRLPVLDVSSDVDLASRYFNPQTFYLGS